MCVSARRGFTLLLAVCAFALFVSGCDDRVNVDRQIFALGIGIDEGEQRLYRFSVIYPEFSGGQTEGEQKLRVAMAEADSIQEATLVINAGLAREVNYSHINYIVASEPVARAGKIRDILYQNEQWISMLASASMIVSKDGAQNFLKGFEMNTGLSFDKQQHNAMREPEKTGLFSYCSMFAYLESCESGAYDCVFSLGALNEYAEEAQEQDKDSREEKSAESVFGIEAARAYSKDTTMDYLPGQTIRDAGAKSEMFGSALFDNERMVGELSGNETQWLMMANGSFRGGYFTLRNAGDISTLPLRLSARKPPRIELLLHDEPQAFITVYLEAQLQGIPVRGHEPQTVLDASGEALVREALSKCISDGLYATGEKCRNARSDAMMLGKQAITHFSTVQEWEEYDWKARYPQTTFSFAVDIKLVNNNTRAENP